MIQCMWKPWPWLRLSDAYTAGASAEQRSALAAAVVEGCCLVKKSSAWLVATVHRSRKDIEAGVVPARTAVLGRE